MKNEDKILKLYMSGVPVTEISELFDITREGVYQKLRRRAGWKGMKKHHSNLHTSERLSRLQEHAGEIVEGWSSGVSMTDIAKEFKTTRKNISDIIKQEVGSTRRMHKRDLKIVEEYKNGTTQTALSKKYRISQPCISRIVRTLG